uniref:Uncharacterized protein n=1 Tax=Arundo donax TaxID=35708 RepID=A0A0A9BWF2_ARUDO
MGKSTGRCCHTSSSSSLRPARPLPPRRTAHRRPPLVLAMCPPSLSCPRARRHIYSGREIEPITAGAVVHLATRTYNVVIAGEEGEQQWRFRQGASS